MNKYMKIADELAQQNILTNDGGPFGAAIIWSNIKMVYYGNTKEDAEKIGFRDNLIYEYLEGQSKTTNKEDILKIIAVDREETIKTFESYQNKSENKTMY